MKVIRLTLPTIAALALGLATAQAVSAQCTQATQTLIGQVWAALEAGDQANGQALIGQLIEGHSTCAETHFALGNLAMVMNQPAEAEAGFGRALEIDPTHARSYSARATLMMVLQREDEALADVAKVLEFSQDVGEKYEAHTLRAAVLYRRQEFDALSEEAELMVGLNPEWGDAYQLRAAVRVERKEWPGVISDLIAANELGRRASNGPEDAEAFVADNMVGLGRARLEMGELSSAKADLDEAIRVRPTNGRAYLYRARVHLGQGRPEEARADLALAIEHARSEEDRAEAQRTLSGIGHN